jgi:hypothetical protein
LWPHQDDVAIKARVHIVVETLTLRVVLPLGLINSVALLRISAAHWDSATFNSAAVETSSIPAVSIVLPNLRLSHLSPSM